MYEGGRSSKEQVPAILKRFGHPFMITNSASSLALGPACAVPGDPPPNLSIIFSEEDDDGRWV